jgi:pyruvate/2-oxoglutarate dehydrogenase complex dihydrolipoamide dehydrogenase (E3) component
MVNGSLQEAKMSYDFDVLVIGAGPAGMAVSIMASEMGLKVATIEKRALGGECMNVGCIPSKALLRIAKVRHTAGTYADYELAGGEKPAVLKPFQRIAQHLAYIDNKKTSSMFKKVAEVKLAEGEAAFVDPHTVEVAGEKLRAKRIFISVGTKPAIPPIPGIRDVDFHTNDNIFKLEEMPCSMTILGGGAIGCEMAQAFTRLGTKCTVIHMDPYLLPHGDPGSGKLLEDHFRQEDIDVYNSARLTKIEKRNGKISVEADGGITIESERLLVAAGRSYDFAALNLGNAGVQFDPRKGIKVDRNLRTTCGNIYAPGDCNGHFLLSHAAMHQGMIALMNSMLPWPMKMDFRKFVVPWTVFTDPQISSVGMNEKQLKEQGIDYEVIESRYEDYGAAIAEGVPVGYVKVFAGKGLLGRGRIHGAVVVGEGSGEMINEWGLAIQKKLRMTDIMMLQHSFPTMGFLTKRTGEIWMMNRMSPLVKKMVRLMF